MQTLRVAVIGGGFIGKQHMEAIRRIPGTQIVAISEMFEASAKRLAEEQAIPAWCRGFHEMLEKEKPDVVHICTPNNTHFQIAKDVINFGAYAYCEKPLGMNSEETTELAKLVIAKGTKAGVNFNYRQNAMVREMHERIFGEINDPLGPVGKVYAVRGHYLQDWMMYDTDYNWRVVPELGGVSRTIADIGSHWFDTVQYVYGHRIVKVFCDMQTVIPQRKKPLKQVKTFETAAPDEYELVDISSEDSAFVIVEFDNGTKGQVTLSQVAGGHKNDLQVDIDGSNYSMTWQQEYADKLDINHRQTGNIVRFAGPDMVSGDAVRYAQLSSGHSVGWADALKNTISEFYRTLRGAEVNYATFTEADYVVRIVEACLKSSKEGRWVEVEQDPELKPRLMYIYQR